MEARFITKYWATQIQYSSLTTSRSSSHCGKQANNMSHFFHISYTYQQPNEKKEVKKKKKSEENVLMCP